MCSYVQRHTGVWLILVAIFSIPALAEECGTIKRYREAISCALKRAPEARRSELELKLADAEVDRARQFQNPELESKNLWNSGNSIGSGEFSTETQLLFNVSISGKRSAQKKLAYAQKESAIALAQSTREKVMLETAEHLHRLRQLETEVFLADEAIERFGRIISAFKRRPQLNPEQRVSLTVFKYALEEEKQKKSRAVAEQSSILSDLALDFGQKVEKDKALFPKLPNKWPDIATVATVDGSDLKLAKSRRLEAKAQHDFQRASAWPNLKIGPAYERSAERDRTEERYGIGIAMELPIFNFNGAGRRSGEIASAIGELESNQAQNATRVKLDSLKEQYLAITTALNSAPSQAELEKGHREFESQFTRGLVSYGLIIEAHRQLHEIVETKHTQELTALNLYWRIHQLTGHLTQEVL